MSNNSIPCNALKPGFDKYRDEYVAAAERVLDSGWYVLGHEWKLSNENSPHTSARAGASD